MKKVIFAIGLVVLLASCGSSVKEEVAVVADSTVTVAVAVDSAVTPSVVVGSTGVTGK